MKIYTRTGDSGTTGLFGGPRVAKDDSRIEAYGTVDELNASLGIIRAAIDLQTQQPCDESVQCGLSALDAKIVQVQHELFSIGAELASPHPDQFDLRVIGQPHIQRMEEWIDTAERDLPPLKQFILPGGSMVASQIHYSRAVCRRAERRVISLADAVQSETPISDSVIIYLNRLSDWLFVASRWVNQIAAVPEQIWEKP
ncbi:cob(I)yrinic acid a,c-diamide adenosyltransferase [Rhodopirellula halodulae]|uniref:cob(I)yrinic acid a,c-diamide adenosyltransferase n=1 Tax=Rhodopirellula halodulae TaxID=2894198 RepID=UPI001E36DBF2|nr:cob(I)yrinic acid a,c-diamide adenosyltransferase [Rhodopirellula sp. JC737]MCC9656385.1 cob(I)yrinic acid a,c-diamide adenosyltransferase [Rhodopirellula sp. JC737]